MDGSFNLEFFFQKKGGIAGFNYKLLLFPLILHQRKGVRTPTPPGSATYNDTSTPNPTNTLSVYMKWQVSVGLQCCIYDNERPMTYYWGFYPHSSKKNCSQGLRRVTTQPYPPLESKIMVKTKKITLNWVLVLHIGSINFTYGIVRVYQEVTLL